MVDDLLQGFLLEDAKLRPTAGEGLAVLLDIMGLLEPLAETC